MIGIYLLIKMTKHRSGNRIQILLLAEMEILVTIIDETNPVTIYQMLIPSFINLKPGSIKIMLKLLLILICK